jgi:hypothetical protein
MMHALYSLPNWLLGTLISGLSVVVTLAASGSSFSSSSPWTARSLARRASARRHFRTHSTT